MFIDNEWHDADSQLTFEDINPATEKVIASIPDASKVGRGLYPELTTLVKNLRVMRQ